MATAESRILDANPTASMIMCGKKVVADNSAGGHVKHPADDNRKNARGTNAKNRRSEEILTHQVTKVKSKGKGPITCSRQKEEVNRVDPVNRVEGNTRKSRRRQLPWRDAKGTKGRKRDDKKVRRQTDRPTAIRNLQKETKKTRG